MYMYFSTCIKHLYVNSKFIFASTCMFSCFKLLQFTDEIKWFMDFVCCIFLACGL